MTKKKSKKKKRRFNFSFPKVKVSETKKGKKAHITNPVAEDPFRVRFP